MCSNRIEYIDFAKAVGIILVIVGHCSWKNSIPYLTETIYSFHMPLFFILSGFFIKPMKISDSLQKYSKAYLLPYAITTLLCLAVTFIFSVFYESNLNAADIIRDWLVRSIFSSGSASGSELFANTPIIGAIWFLPALFWSCLFYSIALRYFSSENRVLFVILLFVLSYLSIKVLRLPFSIQAGVSAIVFLETGHLIRKYDVIERLSSRTSLLLIFPIWIMCIVKGFMSISHCVYGLGLVTIIGSILASVAFINLLKYLRSGGGCRKTMLTQSENL